MLYSSLPNVPSHYSHFSRAKLFSQFVPVYLLLFQVQRNSCNKTTSKFLFEEHAVETRILNQFNCRRLHFIEPNTDFKMTNSSPSIKERKCDVFKDTYGHCYIYVLSIVVLYIPRYFKILRSV